MGGGSRRGDLGWGGGGGGACPQGQALVNHRLPLPSPCPPSYHTITLTRIEYCDQAGGGRNIV